MTEPERLKPQWVHGRDLRVGDVVESLGQRQTISRIADYNDAHGYFRHGARLTWWAAWNHLGRTIANDDLVQVFNRRSKGARDD